MSPLDSPCFHLSPLDPLARLVLVAAFRWLVAATTSLLLQLHLAGAKLSPRFSPPFPFSLPLFYFSTPPKVGVLNSLPARAFVVATRGALSSLSLRRMSLLRLAHLLRFSGVGIAEIWARSRASCFLWELVGCKGSQASCSSSVLVTITLEILCKFPPLAKSKSRLKLGDPTTTLS